MSENASDDGDDQKNKPPQQTRKKSRRKWYLLGLAGVFLILGVGYLVYYLLVAQFYAETDDAYIQGNSVQLAPQISGTVTSIAAEDTDHVTAGQVLVTLDASERRVALDAAEANLAQTVRAVRQLYDQVNEQRSIIAQRESAASQAKTDYERDQRLVKANGITRQAFEHARSTYRQETAALAAARHKLSELQAQTGDTTVRTHPRVKAAEAQLKQAYLALERTRVVAPVSGTVAQRTVQVGEEVSPGKPMLTIVPSHQIWVDANFKETQLASMRLGQPATVVSDFYGSNVVYHGHVAGLSAGTGAAFELLPPQNATGNWIKIVRRLPVRIVLDQSNTLAHHPLRIGLSTEVTVNLHNTSGPTLARQTPQKPRYTTNVYANRMAGAQQLITGIVNANAGEPSGHAHGGHGKSS